MHIGPTLGLLGFCLLPGRIAGSAIQNLECLVVDVVVEALHEVKTATQFCSSYLDIKTQSVTVTNTATASVTLSSTIVTGSTTVYTDTVTVTNRGTVTVTSCPASLLEKRVELAERGEQNIPTGLEKLGASAISKACSCLQIPTPTTTITAKATVTETQTTSVDVITTIYAATTVQTSTTITATVCAIPTTCGNDGLQWAYYSNPDISPNTEKSCDYGTFDPAPIKHTPWLDNGVTTKINIEEQGGPPLYLYGDSEPEPFYFVVNYRGYLLAPTSGTYIFSSSQAVDIILYWIGPDAYSGWTRANANAIDVLNYCSSGTRAPVTPDIDLVALVYYPIRIVYADAQDAPAATHVSITAPDGTAAAGSRHWTVSLDPSIFV